MASFLVETPDGAKSAADALTGGHYHREFIDDPEKCEYFLPVKWLDTVPLDQAIREVGLFGNQNTVCAPRTQRWQHTVDRLKQVFPHYDD
jgi:hypothetical protein